MSWAPNSALVRAYISASALARSARAAVDDGGEVADLRRDAWGHGLLAVARAVHAAGARSVLVDTTEEAEALTSIGIAATTEASADIDAAALYGLPGADGVRRTPSAMRLVGRVMSVKPLRVGEGVSYGYTFRAPRDTATALVTGGYAQGVVRALGNRASVEIGGALHPIVGRVAMDVCVVDVGDAPVREGDEVTFFGGRGPAADCLAAWMGATGLTAAELVANVGMHAHREEEA